MKWAFVIVFCFALCTNSSYSQISARQNCIPQIKAISQINNYVIFIPEFLNLKSKNEKNAYLNYDTIVDLITVMLLLIITFLIVITPVFLISCWIFYSYLYVKKYRAIFSIKKWLYKKSLLTHEHIQKEIWWSYRKVYSIMLGFGTAMMAYLFFSIRFMISNFNSMEVALTEYFSFPFQVLENLKWMETKQISTFPLNELWDDMFIIVIMSFVFFLIGILMGSTLVDLRLNLIEKKISTASNQRKKKKEMFSIKTDKEILVNDHIKAKEVY